MERRMLLVLFLGSVQWGRLVLAQASTSTAASSLTASPQTSSPVPQLDTDSDQLPPTVPSITPTESARESSAVHAASGVSSLSSPTELESSSPSLSMELAATSRSESVSSSIASIETSRASSTHTDSVESSAAVLDSRSSTDTVSLQLATEPLAITPSETLLSSSAMGPINIGRMESSSSSSAFSILPPMTASPSDTAGTASVYNHSFPGSSAYSTSHTILPSTGTEEASTHFTQGSLLLSSLSLTSLEQAPTPKATSVVESSVQIQPTVYVTSPLTESTASPSIAYNGTSIMSRVQPVPTAQASDSPSLPSVHKESTLSMAVTATVSHRQSLLPSSTSLASAVSETQHAPPSSSPHYSELRFDSAETSTLIHTDISVSGEISVTSDSVSSTPIQVVETSSIAASSVKDEVLQTPSSPYLVSSVPASVLTQSSSGSLNETLTSQSVSTSTESSSVSMTTGGERSASASLPGTPTIAHTQLTISTIVLSSVSSAVERSVTSSLPINATSVLSTSTHSTVLKDSLESSEPAPTAHLPRSTSSGLHSSSAFEGVGTSSSAYSPFSTDYVSSASSFATVDMMSSVTVTPPLPQDIRFHIMFEGDCQRLKRKPKLQAEFWRALSSILYTKFESEIPLAKMEAEKFACNPLTVVIVLKHVSKRDVINTLNGSIADSTFEVPILDEMTVLSYKAVKIEKLPTVKPDDSDNLEMVPAGLDKIDIIIIISAGFLFVCFIMMAGILCCRDCYRKKRAASFNLIDVPQMNLKMEDFTLTRIPRPRLAFTGNGSSAMSEDSTNGLLTRTRVPLTGLSARPEVNRGARYIDPENIRIRMKPHVGGLVVGVTCTPPPSPTHESTSSPSSTLSGCADQCKQSLLKGDNSGGGTTNPNYTADDERGISYIHGTITEDEVEQLL